MFKYCYNLLRRIVNRTYLCFYITPQSSLGACCYSLKQKCVWLYVLKSTDTTSGKSLINWGVFSFALLFFFFCNFRWKKWKTWKYHDVYTTVARFKQPYLGTCTVVRTTKYSQSFTASIEINPECVIIRVIWFIKL